MKRLILFIIIIGLCCIGCNGSNSNQKLIVRVVDPYTHEVRTYYPEDGDFIVNEQFHLEAHWEKNRCIVKDSSVENEMSVYSLSVGVPIIINPKSSQAAIAIRCFLSYEDDPLPEEWNALLNNQKRQTIKVLVPIFIQQETYELQTHYREDGDFQFSVQLTNDSTHSFLLYLNWGEEKCKIVYERDIEHPEYIDMNPDLSEVEIVFGEPTQFSYNMFPTSIVFRCYYCYEDDPLPDEWNELLEHKGTVGEH